MSEPSPAGTHAEWAARWIDMMSVDMSGRPVYRYAFAQSREVAGTIAGFQRSRGYEGVAVVTREVTDWVEVPQG